MDVQLSLVAASCARTKLILHGIHLELLGLALGLNEKTTAFYLKTLFSNPKISWFGTSGNTWRRFPAIYHPAIGQKIFDDCRSTPRTQIHKGLGILSNPRYGASRGIFLSLAWTYMGTQKNKRTHQQLMNVD